MVSDVEGFLQPVIDQTKCVHCGKCEQVCPVIHHGEPRKPIAVYAARAKDDRLRAGSASGGIFTFLALDVLKRGGVVFGAGFECPTWRVIHKAAHNEEELDDLRGSKYVQSDIGNTYQEAKQFLDKGIEVLYSGCPCQIAGLLNFLGRSYSNLTTVDLICHGVPSPLAWRKYLDEREREAGAKITRILSRRYCSWQEYALSFAFANGKAYSKNLNTDPFLISFLSELCTRRSCHACTCRHLQSRADMTIGDFWGIEKSQSNFRDNDKGLSVILINTDKGSACLGTSFQSVITEQHVFDDVCRSTNRDVLFENCSPSPFRSTFLKNLQNNSFDLLVREVVGKKTICGRIHHIAWWLKRLIINREAN